MLFVTYSFAYLDRVNYSFAAAGGIATDLGISPSTSSLIGALFFLGYFIGQVPGRDLRRASQRQARSSSGA